MINIGNIIAIIIVVWVFIQGILFLIDHLSRGKKIKCNIQKDGDKVYHVPGDRLYNITKIDESKGEMYTRTETEALENGFRRSKVR